MAGRFGGPTSLPGKRIRKLDTALDWLDWIKEVEAKARAYGIWDEIDPGQDVLGLPEPRQAPNPKKPHFDALDALWWREKTVKELLRGEIWSSLHADHALRLSPLVLDLREMLVQIKTIVAEDDSTAIMELNAAWASHVQSMVTGPTVRSFMAKGEHLLLLKLEQKNVASKSELAILDLRTLASCLKPVHADLSLFLVTQLNDGFRRRLEAFDKPEDGIRRFVTMAIDRFALL